MFGCVGWGAIHCPRWRSPKTIGQCGRQDRRPHAQLARACHSRGRTSLLALSVSCPGLDLLARIASRGRVEGPCTWAGMGHGRKAGQPGRTLRTQGPSCRTSISASPDACRKSHWWRRERRAPQRQSRSPRISSSAGSSRLAWKGSLLEKAQAWQAARSMGGSHSGSEAPPGRGSGPSHAGGSSRRRGGGEREREREGT